MKDKIKEKLEKEIERYDKELKKLGVDNPEFYHKYWEVTAKLQQHEETKKAEQERIWNILLKKLKFWEIDEDVIEELKKEIGK